MQWMGEGGLGREPCRVGAVEGDGRQMRDGGAGEHLKLGMQRTWKGVEALLPLGGDLEMAGSALHQQNWRGVEKLLISRVAGKERKTQESACPS